MESKQITYHKNWQLAMDQLNLFFHFFRGRFQATCTCLQYRLEVLIIGGNLSTLG